MDEAQHTTLRLGKSGKVVLIDEADYFRLSRFNWHLNGSHPYRTRIVTGRRNRIPLSHEVLNLSPAASRSVHIKHVNGDLLDCRRANLKIKRQGYIQFIKGKRRIKPYRVKIAVDGMQYDLGRWPTLNQSL